MSRLRPEQLGTRSRSFIFFFLFSTFGASSAFALDPSLDISQYAHTSWKVRDGFTKGAINTIAQTPDGYLWLGTDNGLLRFDGVRAIPWHSLADDELPSECITSLLASRDGTLWISTSKGLASWKDGKLSHYPEVAGQSVVDLFQDRAGTVWFGAYLPGRLCAIESGGAKCYGAGLFGRAVLRSYEDRENNLWLVAETGVWRWKPGSPKQYKLPHGTAEVDWFIEDADGTLLFAGNDGLKQLVNGEIQSYKLPGVTSKFRPNRLFRSSDGNLWIASQQGLLHLHAGRIDTFGAANGLSGDFVDDIYEDREHNIWVATANGLDVFRDYTVQTISQAQGLSHSQSVSVLAMSDGSIWISTLNGLNRWRDGQVTAYGVPNSLRQVPASDQRQARVILASSVPSHPFALGQDIQGRLLVSARNGVFQFEDNRFVRVNGIPGGDVASVAQDHLGNIWVSEAHSGLICRTAGKTVDVIPWTRINAHTYGAVTILPDASSGGLWLGMFPEGLMQFNNGRVLASYSASDGLGRGLVGDLRFGSSGTLWAATEGGLSRVKDGHVFTLTTKNGLPCDRVHWSIEDDDHSVWLYMSCGLVRIAGSELDAWARNPTQKVQVTLFDSSDGVRAAGNIGKYNPHVSKSPDGRIWFAGTDGVSVIDPDHIPFNKIPPPVHIEKIIADDKPYDATNGVRLPTLVRYLDIDYTALSLVVPEKVRFRVKLEGQDKEWRELVNVRHVEYTNLPPKHYRFLVKACNNSGVWNEEGSSLDFVIPPAWYQTNWFSALCVAAFLALLWALYQYRLHQMARMFNMRLEERVSERTRIARDLHDTLLQSFQGVVFRFQAVRNHLPDRPRDACAALDTALVSADQALAEGRGSIQGLRSELFSENNMEQMLLAIGRELASSQNGEHGCPTLRVIVEGTRRAKRPMIREEIYRIARELLRNAYRHAHARSIEAELRYDDDTFVLIVRDDGKGIDPQVLKEHGRAGHWGLRGIYERAEGMGARLDVWSEAGAGTEVRLAVPGAITYEKSGDGGRFKLLRKKRIYERRS